MSWNAPQDAGQIPLRVQVIDVDSKSLDVVVPLWMPVGDLTQRLAQDAGLDAFWDDGTRRQYWLRARGRVLESTEKLEQLGVVAYELVHLLPEPPAGSQVAERPPDYPATRGYPAKGLWNIGWGMVLVIAWTAGWAMALSVDQRPMIAFLPGIGLSLMAVSVARHLWGGHGSRVRVPITGMLVFLPMFAVAVAPAYLWGDLSTNALTAMIALAWLGGMAGIILGWLAWFGAVEPLPKVTRAEVEEARAALQFPCAICGGPVLEHAKVGCVYQCGRVFHEGCYRTRQSMASGDACAVCGYVPAAS